MSGNGATWKTWAGMPGYQAWRWMLMTWRNAKRYAPAAALTGCHPPKMTRARAIHPDPSQPWGCPHPGLTHRENAAPAIPTIMPPATA